ncbi:LPXTG cell wall anchor domain-containing protein [Enterococcus casseliflavus]|nr:LPXTG cell wall anchor domain-containing protein [Enterococcus casseliflavus]
MREVKGTDSTITYDETAYKVTVKVEDKEGQLVATPTYEGNAIFKNSYTPGSGSAVLEASKELTGKELSANEFRFELVDDQGEVLQIKTNDVNGKIYFDSISYDKAGEYQYTIREVKGTDSTITYDETAYKVTVKVEDKEGQLVATPTYEGNVIFKNSYTPGSGSSVLEANKEQTIDSSQESVFEKENDKIKKSDNKAFPKTGESVNPLYILIGSVCIIFFMLLLVLKNKKAKN